jgi:hypothetical protein
MLKHGDEILDAVCTDWLAGVSGPAIGRKLGLTRNSISSLLRRLRRSGRIPPAPPSAPRRAPDRVPKPKTARQPSRPSSKVSSHPTTLSGSCQWLDGEPRKLRWCGEPSITGSPYCDTHHRRCFVLRGPALPRPAQES